MSLIIADSQVRGRGGNWLLVLIFTWSSLLLYTLLGLKKPTNNSAVVFKDRHIDQ